MSSLLESLVVLDRVAWLQDQLGDSCRIEIVPAFDPRISPTNILIKAIKK
jgi:hypothetical protein